MSFFPGVFDGGFGLFIAELDFGPLERGLGLTLGGRCVGLNTVLGYIV